MSRQLYIIGNGFDRAHGIPSGYCDFKVWLNENDNDLLLDIEDIWENNTQLWNDFERVLGTVDYFSIANKYQNYKLYEISKANRKLRSIHPELPPCEHHGIEEKLKPLVKRIRSAFNQWAHMLNISISNYRPILNLDKEAYYITFNYTETLEVLYKIPQESILHIHGRANSNEEILFGHNKSYTQIQYEVEELRLGCGTAANNDFSLWIGSLIKNVDYNLYRLSPILANNVVDISCIHVLGYSFNEIDATYIDDIFKRTYRNQPMWYISYFTETDKDRISNFLHTYHIVQKYYVLFQVSDIAI